MKFTRRPDLSPQTRIHIVMLAWLNQGVYGKMTELAKAYQISRTFLYQLIFMANLQLEILFSDEKLLFQKDHRHLEQLLLLLRLEGNCSLLSISSILKALEYHSNSVGYLSQFFHSAGQALPSTLLMPSKKLVFYLSDEIFAIHAPILVTIDAQSTAILNIELASDRSAETWKAHFEALENHYFVSLGMASDRGKGVVAGYQAACDMALWVADYFHEFQGLFEVLKQLERKAYAAMNKEYEAARRFDNAKSEAHLQKRLEQYETAHDACERAIALYDPLDLLLDLLRDALHLCSPQGKLRTPEGVRSELRLLFDMLEALDCAAVTRTLKPIRKHLDDILVPFKQLEAIAAELRLLVPHEALDFLVLAWHHGHLGDQSGSKQKRYYRRERDFWLACAEGLVGDAFDSLKALVFDKLDSIVRASSLVEMVNSLIRPYLNSCKGQITQETLNLIMFYHNHRRYKSGKRQGKAPIELLTGKPLEAPWWELLRQQINTGYSSATTLIMNRFKFSGQKFPKCPHMVCESGGHARGSMMPLGLNQSRGIWSLLRQRQAQAHVRSGKVVEGLKQDHTPPHLGPIFTEALAFSHQRRQGMTKRQIETLNQAGADRQPQLRQALATAAHPIHQFVQTSLALLFDDLSIDQIRVRFLHRLLGTTWLSRAWKRLQGMVGLNESRQITAEPVTEKARHAQDHGSRHPNELQGTFQRPRANKRRQDETIFRRKTDPHPLPPILAQVGAFPTRLVRLRMLTLDEAPHLVELHLGDRQLPQQVRVNLVGFVRRAFQPHQDGFFGYAQNKANVRQANFNQEHLERHHHFLFGRPQVKENRIAGFGKRHVAGVAQEDAPFSALRQIRGNGANVPAVHQPIMGTIRVGAWLTPVLRFSHGSILQSVRYASPN